MKSLEKITYIAEEYTGRKIGKSYMHRVGWQVVAYDKNNKRRYAFSDSRSRKFPTKKMGYVAAHYQSGVSNTDSIIFSKMKKEAKNLADQLNCAESARIRKVKLTQFGELYLR